MSNKGKGSRCSINGKKYEERLSNNLVYDDNL